MRLKLGLIFGVLLFALAGWLGYTFYAPSTAAVGGATVTENVDVKVSRVEPAPTPAPAARPATPSRPQTAPAAIVPSALVYRGWEIEEENARPQACFRFSQNLPVAQETALRDYVVTKPEMPISLLVKNNRLCVLGLSYDSELEITIRSGLTAAGGTQLAADQTENISFGDKPPFVGFVGNGIILPKTSGGKLAIKTLNVDAVDLVLYRVNDRILSQTTPGTGQMNVEGSYGYGSDGYRKKVEILRETLTVASLRNRSVVTPFDLAAATADFGQGAYIVEIRRADSEGEYRAASAWRWFIVTDMALSSISGAEALHVSARSIQTAKLLPNVRLDLIAQNNDKLGEATTDGRGRASFPAALLSGKDAAAPRMIMAYDADGDYAVLDLSRSPLDLSTYDVQGRTSNGFTEVFAYTERGIYRPGETVHLTTLLRDPAGNALSGRKISARVLRPNDTEYRVYDLSASETAGGTVTSFELPASAPRGRWSIQFSDEALGAIHTEKFSVEDFVPQQLRVSIKADTAAYTPNTKRALIYDAQFFYGAPGAELAAESEIRVQVDPNPFPDFKAYQFGDETERYQEQFEILDEGLTNKDGIFETQLNLRGKAFASTLPLRAALTAGVAEPGGRYVRDSVFIPVRSGETYFGIKPEFDGYADRRNPVSLSVVAVAKTGERKAAQAAWALYEEDYDYHWYRENGRWRYREDVRDILIDKGEAAVAADAPWTWSSRLGYGRFRFEVTNNDGAKTAKRFGVGWSRGGADSSAPDKLTMGVTGSPSRAGQPLVLNINAPFAGQGDLIIADANVRSLTSVNISEGASEIRLPYEASWGKDVYALLTLYSPLGEQAGQTPRRAVGLAHVAIPRSENILQLAINAPEKLAPRQTVELSVDVANIPRGETAWMSVAVVDQGILQLTKYSAPDAAKTLFGKKAFTLDMRDDYARILDPFAADGAGRTGGGAIGGAGLTVVPTKTVSLFEGPVKVSGGKATVSLDLPDFNGELRLMATAWSRSAVGSASTEMIVRDPVPVTLSLPRFLAPGDKAVATLIMDNLDGPEGVYRPSLTAENLLTEIDGESLTLVRDQRDQLDVRIEGDVLGATTNRLSVAGPNGYALQSEYPIQVRSPFRPVTKSVLRQIKPGETFELGENLREGFVAGSVDISVGVSRLPGLDPAPILQALRKYPYGCTEQTVSTAMPLLYVSQLGGVADQSDFERRRQLEKAIDRLVSRQSADGAFGLWRAGDGNASPWVSLYATDFLQRAKALGHTVPDAVMERALRATKKLSDMDKSPGLNLDFDYGYRGRSNSAADIRRAERAAYAHYILVKADAPNLSGLRYLADNLAPKFTSSAAHSYLGRALRDMGDETRAEKAFRAAREIMSGKDSARYDYYATSVRNAAALLAMGGAELPDDILSGVTSDLAAVKTRYLNTQEMGYLVLAMAELSSAPSRKAVKAEASGFSLAGGQGALLDTDLAGASITSADSVPFWASITATGAPTTAPPAADEHFKVTKSLRNFKGEEISAALKQGERGVIVLSVAPKVNNGSMIVIADLLPAGFEIERILTSDDTETRGGSEPPFAWIGTLGNFDMSEARDDRFVASYRQQRYGDDRAAKAAYIVRAVTRGDFVFPGVVAEDMYRPERFGRTETTRIQVAGGGQF